MRKERQCTARQHAWKQRLSHDFVSEPTATPYTDCPLRLPAQNQPLRVHPAIGRLHLHAVIWTLMQISNHLTQSCICLDWSTCCNLCLELACWAFSFSVKSSPVSRILPLTSKSMKLPGWTPFLISGTCVNLPSLRDFPPFKADFGSLLVRLWVDEFSLSLELTDFTVFCSASSASFKGLLFGSSFTAASWSSSKP